MKQRLSNFELLRILSMMMIVSFHYVFKGGFSFDTENMSINKLVFDIIYHFGEIGVNLFVLISGYFFDKTKFTWGKVLSLILQVEFYFIVSLAILVYVFGHSWTEWHLIDFVFPLYKGNFWFVSAYILLYIFTPYLKLLIDGISKEQFQKLLITQIVLWSIIPTIMPMIIGIGNSENMPNYTRYVWFYVLYFIGAYIKLYGVSFVCNKKKSLIALVASFSLLVLFILLVEYGKLKINNVSAVYFWTPNSIILLMISVSIFYVFANISVPHSRVLNYVANCTLGVYLLHDGVLVGELWYAVFKNNTHQYSNKFILHICFAVVVIFCAGILIETIRKTFFSFINVVTKKSLLKR